MSIRTSPVGTSFTGTGQVITAASLPPGATFGSLVVFDTSGAANVVRLYDGTANTDPLLAVVSVAADGGAVDDAALGRRVTTGVYAECTGSVKARVFVG